MTFDFTPGHIVSMMVGDGLWHAAFAWSLAAVLWFVYCARRRRRTASLVCAIFFTLIPIPFVLHLAFADGPVAEFRIFWIIAAFVWLGYFRLGPSLRRPVRVKRVLVFLVGLSVFSFPPVDSMHSSQAAS